MDSETVRRGKVKDHRELTVGKVSHSNDNTTFKEHTEVVTESRIDPNDKISTVEGLIENKTKNISSKNFRPEECNDHRSSFSKEVNRAKLEEFTDMLAKEKGSKTIRNEKFKLISESCMMMNYCGNDS